MENCCLRNENDVPRINFFLMLLNDFVIQDLIKYARHPETSLPPHHSKINSMWFTDLKETGMLFVAHNREFNYRQSLRHSVAFFLSSSCMSERSRIGSFLYISPAVLNAIRSIMVRRRTYFNCYTDHETVTIFFSNPMSRARRGTVRETTGGLL